MLSTCGKNVYNTWKDGGITCQNVSTVPYDNIKSMQTMCVNYVVVRTFIPHSPRHLSTAKNANPPQLNSSYTHNPQDLLLTLRRKN